MRAAAVLLAVFLAPSLDGVQPAGIANARLQRRSATSGLEAAVASLLASQPGTLWIGWTVPAIRPHRACCWSSGERAGRGRGGCRLEANGNETVLQDDDEAPVAVESGNRFRVLLRAVGGRVERIRAFSEDCPLDAGGLPFVWLEDVRPRESVALLAKRIGQPEDRGLGRRLDDAAMAALAFHAEPDVDAALDRFVAAGQPLERRQQAAFWMGQLRGEHGYRALVRLVREDADPRFRDHAVFALSQSRAPKAIDTIIDVARHDASAQVRGQALFWLAQAAAARAVKIIQSALDEDPETEVTKKAVFALSQLPRHEGVPLLIRLARTHKNTAVRKEAMFWLGQSRDPRALSFFEEVLGR